MTRRRLRLAALMACLGTMPAAAQGLDLDGTPLVTAAGEPVAFGPELFPAPATVISFTYSGCRSVCPVSDLVMDQFATAAADAGFDVALITITLDPLNDTPEVLAAHRDKAGLPDLPRWRWLTGEARNVWAVLDRLGIGFGALDDHASFFLVVGRAGAVTRRLREQSATTRTLLEAARAVAASGAR